VALNYWQPWAAVVAWVIMEVVDPGGNGLAAMVVTVAQALILHMGVVKAVRVVTEQLMLPIVQGVAALPDIQATVAQAEMQVLILLMRVPLAQAAAAVEEQVLQVVHTPAAAAA
jgi:hypothetical protein